MRTRYAIHQRRDGSRELVERPRWPSSHAQRQQIQRMAVQVGLSVAQLPLPPWCETVADLSSEDARGVMDGLGHLRWAGGPIMSARQRAVLASQRKRLGWKWCELVRFAREIVEAYSVDFLTAAEARRLIRVLRRVPHRRQPMVYGRGPRKRPKRAGRRQEVA